MRQAGIIFVIILGVAILAILIVNTPELKALLDRAISTSEGFIWFFFKWLD